MTRTAGGGVEGGDVGSLIVWRRCGWHPHATTTIIVIMINTLCHNIHTARQTHQHIHALQFSQPLAQAHPGTCMEADAAVGGGGVIKLQPALRPGGWGQGGEEGGWAGQGHGRGWWGKNDVIKPQPVLRPRGLGGAGWGRGRAKGEAGVRRFIQSNSSKSTQAHAQGEWGVGG